MAVLIGRGLDHMNSELWSVSIYFFNLSLLYSVFRALAQAGGNGVREEHSKQCLKERESETIVSDEQIIRDTDVKL